MLAPDTLLSFLGSDMFRIILATLLLIISFSVSFFSLIYSIALSKEGLSMPEAIHLAEYVGFILTAMGCWYITTRLTTIKYIRNISYIFIGLALIPLSILSLIISVIFTTYYMGKIQSTKTIITHYHESFIEWPEFSYPIGLHIEIDLPAALAVTRKQYAGFYAPLIWMGPAITENARMDQYFLSFGHRISINEQTPTLSILSASSYIKQPKPFITKHGDSKIVFDLYPGMIEYIIDKNSFCTLSAQPLDSYSQGMPEAFAIGTELNAIWFYVGATNVDLSAQITKALHQQSQLQNNQPLWINMQQQFSDDNLLRAGYHSCTIHQHKHCFCK